MPAKARIAVVGTGWWACDWHIPALLENHDAELIALCDIDPDRLARAAHHFGINQTFADVDSLLARAELDGVVVATNHVAHYEVARQCFEHNLHVLVEKPMVLHARQGKELVELAQAKGRELIVGFPWNYYPFVDNVVERLGPDDFGAVQYVHSLHANHILGFLQGHDEWMPNKVHGPGSAYADPNRSGGGYGHTQITHFAGLVNHLTGLKAERVNARMANQGLAVDLVDAIIVQYEGGALGVMGGTGNSGGQETSRFKIDIYCEQGFVELSAYPLHCQMHSPKYGTEHAGSPFFERLNYPGKAPANNLVDVVLKRGPNKSPGEVGWRAAELLHAAYRSAAEDGRTVYIEELYL